LRCLTGLAENAGRQHQQNRYPKKFAAKLHSFILPEEYYSNSTGILGRKAWCPNERLFVHFTICLNLCTLKLVNNSNGETPPPDDIGALILGLFTMITMKFGGTSVGDIQRLKEVVAIVRSNLTRRPVVVASAMSGITDMLLNTAQLAVQREMELVQKNVEDIKIKHLQIADALVSQEERRKELLKLQTPLLEKLTALYRGVSLLGELSLRSLDAIASFGEMLSCMQIAAILNDNGIAAQFVDARTLIRTDAHFGDAVVDFSLTNAYIRNALMPQVQSHIVPVVTGFIGSTEDGITTTLGRSGSDYTGSIVGAALESEEIWIWTDVDGVMTADPRYVNGALVLPELSYREAAEMSYFGAKVIHPKTMQPAIENSIPIRIKNTFNPAHPGTLISKVSSAVPGIVKNVTSINDLGLIAIEGNGMVGVPGISARIFAALARISVNVMMISQASSEHNVCLVVPQRDCMRAVQALRHEFETDIAKKIVDDIKLREGVSIVAVVGEGMQGVPGISGKTFSAVAQECVNVIAIAQGSSELNISLVVSQSDVRKTVQAIHDAFHLTRD
jgi:bifunctional aspartokinase / homoserine dehydrogenase 1